MGKKGGMGLDPMFFIFIFITLEDRRGERACGVMGGLMGWFQLVTVSHAELWLCPSSFRNDIQDSL